MRFFRRGDQRSPDEHRPEDEPLEAPEPADDIDAAEVPADDLIGDEWRTATPVDAEDPPVDEVLSDAELALAPSPDALFGQVAVPEPVTMPPEPVPEPEAQWAWGADY